MRNSRPPGQSNTTLERKTAVIAPLPVDTTIAWTTLGMKWMQMLAASGHVIACRTSRPNTPVQLLEMGSEKIDAALESSSAMSRQLMGFPFGNALAQPDAWARLLMTGLAPFHARTMRNVRRP